MSSSTNTKRNQSYKI